VEIYIISDLKQTNSRHPRLLRNPVTLMAFNLPQTASIWPSPLLMAPEWSEDSQPSDEYIETPLQSPGVYTPLEGPPGTSFGQGFTSTSPSNLVVHPKIDYYDDFLLSGSLPHHLDARGQSLNSRRSILISPPINSRASLPELRRPSRDEDAASPASYVYTTTAEPSLKSSLGTSKEQCQDSVTTASTSRSTRSKTAAKKVRSRKTSTGPSTQQIRSIRSGRKASSSSKDDPVYNDGSQASRNNHNLVEKQYRNRLNSQFETLLSTLPPDVVAAEAGRTSTYGGEKRVSKGEVLILAKNYIETLEKTRDELENSNSMLRQNVQQLKMDLVQRNGDAMPW
jgi:hypothetical protein